MLQHTRLTTASGPESDPALSPDGKWFVYVSSAAGNPDVYLQSVGGQTPINLTKDSPAADDEPAFSPDGERIAFRSARDGGGLYVMGRTGEAPRRVAPGGRNPAWSPDGQSLVYSTVAAAMPTSRAVVGTLRVVRIDTGEVRDLTTQDALNPSWSPNGKFVAFWGLSRVPGGGAHQQTGHLGDPCGRWHAVADHRRPARGLVPDVDAGQLGADSSRATAAAA